MTNKQINRKTVFLVKILLLFSVLYFFLGGGQVRSKKSGGASTVQTPIVIYGRKISQTRFADFSWIGLSGALECRKRSEIASNRFSWIFRWTLKKIPSKKINFFLSKNNFEKQIEKYFLKKVEKNRRFLKIL